MTTRRYTSEQLREAVAASSSVMEVLRRLGIKPAGGSHTNIKRRIDREGIDMSHFLGKKSSHFLGGLKNGRNQPKAPEEILIQMPEGSHRMHTHILRRAMKASGMEERCVDCPITDTYNGKPIRLEIDHIDGNYLNNEVTNLAFRCPNCHSQTSNYGNKMRRMTVKKFEELYIIPFFFYRQMGYSWISWEQIFLVDIPRFMARYFNEEDCKDLLRKMVDHSVRATSHDRYRKVGDYTYWSDESLNNHYQQACEAASQAPDLDFLDNLGIVQEYHRRKRLGK
jgi:hypothetical protein